MEELDFYRSMDVPAPTISPIERLRALMATRNEWSLYRRRCDATCATIISSYPEDSPFTVYSNASWWGDSWNALQYGRDFDFNRPFFEQFAELQRLVPREGTTIFNSENCDYNSHIRLSKNCYLNSLVFKCEDASYSYWLMDDKDVMDCLYTNSSTQCFSCSDVNRCYHCIMIAESNDCSDCYFSYQLQGCDHCIFSSNLVHKSYHAFNKPVSKEEFEAIRAEALDGSWKSWNKAWEKFLELRRTSTHRAFHSLKTENCSGEHLFNCKNCLRCYDSYESEDCFNTISACESKDIYNCYSAGWQRCERIHMSCVSRTSTNIAFCTYTWFSSNLRYCDACVSCQDCFGCIGLRHKQYCILNKQYTKEEYAAMTRRIREHMEKTWPRTAGPRGKRNAGLGGPALSDAELTKPEFGKFFPPALSPFAFNETAAHIFFPLSKEEAKSRGYRWRDDDAKKYLPATLAAIPDSIQNVPDSITQEILACEKCSKNYRIIPKELAYYRTENMPIPRHCPSCRHLALMRLRTLPDLQKRPCSQCGTTMETTYGSDQTEKIVCEACYLAAIY